MCVGGEFLYIVIYCRVLKYDYDYDYDYQIMTVLAQSFPVNQSPTLNPPNPTHPTSTPAMSRPTITIDSTHLHSPSVTPNNNSTTTTTTTTSSSSSAADTSTAAVPRQQHARYPSASSSITSAPSSPRLVLGGGSIGSIGSSSSQKKNRSALRQFYGLTSAAAAAPGVGGEEAASAASAAASGELDSPEKPGMVDPVAYVDGLCKTADLRALLRVENELINEIRGLDGERKALVYDNYSKLISATDTIKKV